MDYFDGQYQRKKPLTIDHNKQETLETRLQKSREDRIKWQLEQQKNRETIGLQALIRGALTRISINKEVITAFDQSTDELSRLSSSHPSDVTRIEPLLSRLLSLLSLLFRKISDHERLLTVCQILRSNACKAVILNWISTDSPKSRYPLGGLLLSILRSLHDLPPQSTSYATPVRTLETILITPCAHSASTLHFQIWMYSFLAQNHYFQSMARFIDNQLPPSAGYLTMVIDSDEAWEFDASEFERTPRCREFLKLLLAPLEWAQISHQSSVMESLLVCALNDILVPDAESSYSPSERIIRGIGPRIFDTPLSIQSIPNLLIPFTHSTATDNSNSQLRPSINLLHILSTLVVPRLVHGDVSLQTSLHLPDTKTSALDLQLALVLVHSLSWLMTQAFTSPESPTLRPMRKPKPLTMQSLDDSDDEAEEQDKVVSDDQYYDEFTTSEWKSSWRAQRSEIFNAFDQMLDHLASICLTASTEILPCGQEAMYPHQLVQSLSVLHYALSQIYALPASKMIGLNSTYSRHPAFLRSLWYWIDVTANPSDPIINHDEAGSVSRLFTLLATGELPADMRILQCYLPMIFTFADCLQHRLLCLTDTQICSSTPDGCGFQTDDLLKVGVRLRDLMLGVIDLSHPDRLSNFISNSSQIAIPYRPYACLPRPKPVTIQQALERMEKDDHVSETQTYVPDFSIRENLAFHSMTKCIQLRCWISLFSTVQRLVLQIYDWHRRCDRLSQTVRQPTANASRLSNRTQQFWLKTDLAYSIDSAVESRLKRDEDRNLLTLAGVPFGFYSWLNPDRDDDSCLLPNREVRQILILKEMPFVIPFERRVKLFQSLIKSSRESMQGSPTNVWSIASGLHPHLYLHVRRAYLYEDAFEKLSKQNEPSLHPRLIVRFRNQFGLEEPGVDAGGLSREFLNEVVRAGFDPARGLFSQTPEQTLYPNPGASIVEKNYLEHYFFLGRILAKVLYENILVDVQFAHFFLAKITSRSGVGVGFDYLQSLDPELYRQLGNLKTYTGDIRDLSLDFTIIPSALHQCDTVELKPDGRHIPVTDHNRIEYMHLVADYKLNKQIQPQVRAFISGLNDVICIDWLRMFDANELQVLISGADADIDIDDLKRNTVYQNASPEHQETLDHFWAVLKSFSENEKRSFLRFVTACPRPPMFGFADLQPPFSVLINDDLGRLPSASTCGNILHLPNFRDEALLRERLLYALDSAAGFEYG